MAPTAAFLVLLALMSDPFCFHHNGTIWAPNMPLLTLLRPILVIAAGSDISYAGNTHNNHIIASLRRTSRNHVRFKPPPFHQNGIIWALKAPLLTLRWPFLVIAACSHISYAGNTHNNLTSSNLPQSRPFQAASEDDDAMLVRKQGEPLHPAPRPRPSHTGTLASTKGTNTERGGGGGIQPKISTSSKASPSVNIWRISTSEVGKSI